MENTGLKVGSAAPEFDLMNQDKKQIKLSDFRGKKKVVLLFYPMDFSPVCTQEHCEFGPQLATIAPDSETIVFGVSCDSIYTHAAYRKQYNIPYDLLADTSREMAKAYGMWAGLAPHNCTKRGTVVIGKDGKISYYKEQPTLVTPRTVAELAAAASV
jgi:peroxiredoxin